MSSSTYEAVKEINFPTKDQGSLWFQGKSISRYDILDILSLNMRQKLLQRKISLVHHRNLKEPLKKCLSNISSYENLDLLFYGYSTTVSQTAERTLARIVFNGTSNAQKPTLKYCNTDSINSIQTLKSNPISKKRPCS